MATAATKTTGKKRVAKRKAVRKAATKKAEKKAPAKKKVATTTQPKKHVEGNPYRAGSYYATCFDCLSKMGSKKPVSRQKLLTAYCKASGKENRLAKFDLNVVLSPRQDGCGGHRSSRKHAYWVERLENSMVRLHMAN